MARMTQVPTEDDFNAMGQECTALIDKWIEDLGLTGVDPREAFAGIRQAFTKALDEVGDALQRAIDDDN
jgi:hypothetical protein